jgi:hypothetical protein
MVDSEKTQEYKLEGEQDDSKLPFTAVAATTNEIFAQSQPQEIRDLPQYIPQGAPATRKEVWSYYAFYAADNGIGSFQ